MKRILLAAGLVLFTVTGAFAQIQLSAGGGIHFDYEAGISGVWGNEPKLGVFGFFDATYGELDLNFGYNFDRELIFFNIGLFGKYPFDLGVLTLSPMIGVNFHFPFGNDFTLTWTYTIYSIGAGIDYPLSEKLFIKGNLLFNMTFHGDFRVASLGPQVNIGVGYKL